MDATMAAVGFEELGASQEMQADYRQLFLDMAKLAKYSLGEVTEIEDGFEIQVTVEPFVGTGRPGDRADGCAYGTAYRSGRDPRRRGA